MTKVLVSDLEEKIELENKISIINTKVHNRINYIKDKICDLYGRHKSYWQWSNHQFDYKYHKNDLNLGIKISSCGANVGTIILKDGTRHRFYNCVFPQRWLYEDFEEELIEGKKKYDDYVYNENTMKEALEKEKQALKKEKQEKLRQEQIIKKALLDQAFAKLTEEEQIVLCDYMKNNSEG